MQEKMVITGPQASRSFFYTLPPSQYEVADQSKEYHSNHHLFESNAAFSSLGGLNYLSQNTLWRRLQGLIAIFRTCLGVSFLCMPVIVDPKTR